MSVSVQSRTGDEQQIMEQMQRNVLSQLRVALPGIIQSFDPDTVTAVVQPALKGSYDGKSVPMPLLVDVPVVFPGAGDVFITFPVNLGDECELHFNDRCIDFFWQSGGVQEPVDSRMHDLSDATCYVGQISQPNRIKNLSTTTSQFRSADGSTFFDLNPKTQKIKIVAPGGLDVVAPESTFSEKVTINGLLSWMGGMVGSAAKGVAAKITGAVEFLGSVMANGKAIDETHKHGGVQRGGSDTDGVS
ncbi:TPA: Gp138 family membrane-puncturing spike protein [Enterobacter ludwigii]